MEKFNKITVGFVIQTFEENTAGEFTCTKQEFIAGDQVDYEDQDGNDKHADSDDPNRFEFIGGCIILKIDSITEATLEHWKQQQVHLHSIGKLPRTKSAHKKCKALLAVCEYIRDCLDVGGEQSRQFADEIAYLNRAIKEVKL